MHQIWQKSSIKSDACMTVDYTRGQPASAWPLAGQPCKVDSDLHTIARAHNNTFFVLIGTLGSRLARSRMCYYVYVDHAQYTIKIYAKMALFRLVLTGPLSNKVDYSCTVLSNRLRKARISHETFGPPGVLRRGVWDSKCNFSHCSEFRIFRIQNLHARMHDCNMPVTLYARHVSYSR